jgi:hypothetical protein
MLIAAFGSLVATVVSIVVPTQLPVAAATYVLGTPLPPARPMAMMSAQTVTAPAYPYADTFKLHSNPGASHVIYLDFNGETISGTAWNDNYNSGASFNAVAFDTDGNTASFSNGELDLVQGVWQRVAEDYAPFAIDVTTEDPGAAAIDRDGAGDNNFGTKALITNTTTIYSSCSCSGLAWVGVYGMASSHQQYQPALIFAKALGADDKNLGDSVSHEVGHNLGLDHDGKGADGYYMGAGSWAPIMGAGFYRPMTQFSKGEYADATNKQDDFSVIQQNGAPLRTDDYGDATTNAAVLPASGSVSGVITTDADADMFSFVGSGGTQTFTATPAAKGPNLDIRLDMFDAGANLVATADPASGSTGPDSPTGLAATLSKATTAGATYYVRVAGVGSGDPLTTGYSGYGSVGQWTLTGPGSDSTATGTPSMSISDAVVTEGNSGTSAATFTLSLSAPSASPVTVHAATSETTATAGVDFDAASTTVTIPAGQTSVDYTVAVDGDTTPEPHEKFSLALSSPTGATVADSSGLATIVNDDGVGISINDVAKFEGGIAALTSFTFTVTLSTVPSSPIGVTLKTVNSRALSPLDFTSKTMTLSFAAGQKTKTFTVIVKGDKTKEASEQFFVNLSNPTGTGARITDAQGIGTIRNDDA